VCIEWKKTGFFVERLLLLLLLLDDYIRLLYCYVCVLIVEIGDRLLGRARPRPRPRPPPRALAQRLVPAILCRNKMHKLVG